MLIELESITKRYVGNQHDVAAVHELSLQLDQGQFVAVSGASGSGKSTLLLICGALLRPDRGVVRLDDRDLYAASPDERAEVRACQIGFVFQQFHLVSYLNVIQNILAMSLGLPRTKRAERPLRNRAHELAEEFGLSDRLTHLPSQLSTGERQRVAMARALLNQPRLVLADEPTGNLDDENAAIVLNRLREFASGGGTVLMVTHDHEAADYADKVLKMADGQLENPVEISPR